MLTVSKSVSRPRVTFSPSGYRKARKRYDQGDYRDLIAMMQEAAIDSHVSGCLMGRRAGFKRAFSLTSFDDTDTDTQRRDWMQGTLQRLRLRDLLEGVHDGRLYIYSVVDFDWEVIDSLQAPVAFKAFDQRYFRYDEQRVLKVIDGANLQPIPDTALVVENPKTPVMMPVLRDYILKDYGLESWAGFLENFGEPFIIAKYPAASGTDFKQQVDDGLAAVGSSTRISVPQGTDVEFHESGRTTGDHQKFVEQADKGISITLLGHANAVEQGRGLQIGDHPTGYEVRLEVAIDDCYFIEPFVNRLIQMVYDRNWSDGRYPQFELNKQKPVNAKQHTEIVRQWYEMGAVIHPDEMRKAGLYVYDDQEPLQRPANPLSLLD